MELTFYFFFFLFIVNDCSLVTEVSSLNTVIQHRNSTLVLWMEVLSWGLGALTSAQGLSGSCGEALTVSSHDCVPSPGPFVPHVEAQCLGGSLPLAVVRDTEQVTREVTREMPTGELSRGCCLVSLTGEPAFRWWWRPCLAL